ncbi:MAG: spore germination protein [Clostridia bacterium]|nr:spore germination protein [Clostridia bacterium]
MDGEKLREKFFSVFSDMADFSVRELIFGKTKLYIAYFVGFSSREYMNKYIIEPISRAYASKETGVAISSLITNIKIEMLKDFSAAKDAVLAGNAVLFGDIREDALGISIFTKNDAGRSPNEPDTENVIRGAHEGFTESGENNVVLLRRRIHSAKLKRKSFSVGDITKTDISVLYMEGIAKESLVADVCKRISDIRTDAVLDSGYVEIFIQDGKTPFYPTVGNSERPDKVAAKLMEGRAAIVVDGSPVVLTAPYLFCEAFQVTEDYSKSPWYATFIRLLRFVAYLIALYLPALFVALFVRHKGILPEMLLASVTEARANLPFSLFWEVLVIFLIFEAVREVGLRMPKAIGSAIGLVGPLLLGDSAIKAGITSAPILIVVALAAVCNFIVPPYMNTNILYRFFMIIISGALGFFGFFLAIAASVMMLCAKSSFGTPYLSPFAPIDPWGLRDFIFMAPLWAMKRAPISITGKSIRRTDGKK